MVPRKQFDHQEYTLRPYQKDAAKAILDDIDEHMSCAAVLPTGSGKSLIIVELIDRLRERCGFSDSILILCHLRQPLQQLIDTYFIYGERPKRLKQYEKYIPTISYDIIFASMQKMSWQASKEEWRRHMAAPMGRKPKYVIIDEAHMYGAQSYEDIKKLMPDARIIGLSATPWRQNRYSFHLFDRVSYTITLGQLVEMGYLTPPKITIVNDKGTDSERMATAFRIWREHEKNRGLLTVVYFPTTDLAKSALTAYTQQGARVRYIDGKTGLKESRRVLAACKAGEVDILVNCQKLETGVDIARVGAVIMPWSVGSVVRYVQRMGRALRLYPDKDHAMIYLCGEPPPLARGNWQRLHDFALKQRESLPSEELEMELEESGRGPRLEWSKEAIEACKHLEAGEHIALSDLLAFRKFPKKYDLFISSIMKLGKSNPNYDKSSVSPIQRKFLIEKYNFKPHHVDALNKRDASALINGFEAYLSCDPYIIQSGMHLGKHPTQLAPLARKHARGETLRKLKAWWNAGRPAFKGEVKLVSRFPVPDWVRDLTQLEEGDVIVNKGLIHRRP